MMRNLSLPSVVGASLLANRCHGERQKLREQARSYGTDVCANVGESRP